MQTVAYLGRGGNFEKQEKIININFIITTGKLQKSSVKTSCGK